MAEILFYHLTESTLEKALPGLVEKSIERDWRVVIQTGKSEEVQELDELLWVYRDDSFLPHGSVKDGHEADQPIWITDQQDNPNQAHIRFLVGGSAIENASEYNRVVYMFDGHNNASLENARASWKFHKDQGVDELTYWQQNDRGGWEKKA